MARTRSRHRRVISSCLATLSRGHREGILPTVQVAKTCMCVWVPICLIVFKIDNYRPAYLLPQGSPPRSCPAAHQTEPTAAKTLTGSRLQLPHINEGSVGMKSHEKLISYEILMSLMRISYESVSHEILVRISKIHFKILHKRSLFSQ